VGGGGGGLEDTQTKPGITRLSALQYYAPLLILYPWCLSDCGVGLGSRSNVLLYEIACMLNPLCALAAGHPNATDVCVCVWKTTYRDRDLY